MVSIVIHWFQHTSAWVLCRGECPCCGWPCWNHHSSSILSGNMLASNLPGLDEECIVSVAENACRHCLDIDILSSTYRHQGCVRVIVLIKLSNNRTSFFATKF
jgi:hypothetical protein